MSDQGIRLYTDEDVDPRVAYELRRYGYDALSCHEAGNSRRGYDDEWQLRFATRNERTILSFNIRDFVTLDRLWKADGQIHFGILLAENRVPLAELIHRVRLHLDTVPSLYQQDVLLYLPAPIQ